MDLSRLSDGDIQTAIQKMQKGIEIKPGSVEAAELQTSIDRALEELQRRAQKKSKPQPIEKTEQLEKQNEMRLPTKAELGAWAKGTAQSNQEGAVPPIVNPKPTATIHFAGQPMPGQYTRGELWSDVRQNFKLVLLSATFRRCLGSGDYSELWSSVLFVKLYQGIHEGLKNWKVGKITQRWNYLSDIGHMVKM